MLKQVLGKDLKVGDVVKVWWSPGFDKIVGLRPYNGRLDCLKDAKLADFALYQVGMTIEAGIVFEVVS